MASRGGKRRGKEKWMKMRDLQLLSAAILIHNEWFKLIPLGFLAYYAVTDKTAIRQGEKNGK